jgi:hypothetical protein
MDEIRVFNEYQLLKEIRILSDFELNKLIELILLFKNEVRNTSSNSYDSDLQDFLKSFGSWEDSKNSVKIVEEIRNSRNLNRDISIP